MDVLRKYLLGSTVAFQAPDTPGTPDEAERIEVDDPEDDETSKDPVEEEDTEETESPEGADEEAAAAPPSDRGRRQFGALRQTNRTLAEENATLTRRLAELEGRVGGLQQHYAQQPVETAAQREHRLAQLSPEERLRTEFREELQTRDRQLVQMRYEGFAVADKASFMALTTRSTYAKRFADEVEKDFNERLRAGRPVERELIFKQILAEKVLAQEGKPRKRAAENRQRQAARPVNSGSDTRASRARTTPGSAADYEARFGDVPI